MGNWSSDTYYFGKAVADPCPSYIEHQMDVLKLLRFDAHDVAYIVHKIDLCGPTVRISGSGRWGCGIPIPEDVWAVLNQDIVIWEGLNGFDDDVGISIRIAGECVFSQDTKIWDHTPWTRYMGRSPDEQEFFERMWGWIDRERSERFEREAFALLPEKERTRLLAEIDAKYERQREEGWEHHRQWEKERQEREASGKILREQILEKMKEHGSKVTQ